MTKCTSSWECSCGDSKSSESVRALESGRRKASNCGLRRRPLPLGSNLWNSERSCPDTRSEVNRAAQRNSNRFTPPPVLSKSANRSAGRIRSFMRLSNASARCRRHRRPILKVMCRIPKTASKHKQFANRERGSDSHHLPVTPSVHILWSSQ